MRDSHAEDAGITRLDILARLLDCGRIITPKFDLTELARAGLLDDLRMHGMLAGEIDQQLLRFARVQPVLEQPRRIGVRRRLEYRARSDHQRSALGRVDHLYWLPGLLELDEVVIVPVRHHRALAAPPLLRRVGRWL